MRSLGEFCNIPKSTIKHKLCRNLWRRVWPPLSAKIHQGEEAPYSDKRKKWRKMEGKEIFEEFPLTLIFCMENRVLREQESLSIWLFRWLQKAKAWRVSSKITHLWRGKTLRRHSTIQQNCRLEGDKGAIAFSGEVGRTVVELMHRQGWSNGRASDF